MELTNRLPDNAFSKHFIAYINIFSNVTVLLTHTSFHDFNLSILSFRLLMVISLKILLTNTHEETTITMLDFLHLTIAKI